MPLIDAFLALALTMLSLATVATMIVELGHRLLRTRAKDLEKMLGAIFDEEFKPWIDDLSKDAQENLKKNVIKKLVSNPLVPEDATAALSNLDVEDMFKRLASTELGEKISGMMEFDEKLGKMKGKGQEILVRLEHRYDEFGKAASDLFKRRAQLVSLIVGVVLAFAANIDGYAIFTTYLDEPELRAQAINNAENTLSNWEQVQKQLEKKKVADGDAAADPTNSQDGAKLLASIESDVSEIKSHLQSTQQAGLPIGWDHFETAPSSNCLCKIWFYFCWFFKVLVTGFMIGLGGPFWFNVVQKLLALRQAVKGGGDASGQQAGSAPAEAKQPHESFHATTQGGKKPQTPPAQAPRGSAG